MTVKILHNFDVTVVQFLAGDFSRRRL